MDARATVSDEPVGHQAPAPSQRAEAIARDGFFVWPDLVPHDVIDEHVAAHAAWLDERGRPTPEEWAALSRAEQVRTFMRDYDWHEQSATALTLYYRPELIEFLRGLFGAEPVMRAPQTGERQRGSSLHTDGGAFDPPGSEIRVWYALEDIDPASGPVYMIAGTHHLIDGLRERLLHEHPDLASAFVEAANAHMPTDPTPQAYLDLGRAITDEWYREIRERRLPVTVPTLFKGDAIVFRTDVAHGTMPCADPSLTRRSALAFFMAQDAIWREWPACAVEGPEAGTKSWRLARNDHGLYVADWLIL